MGNINKKNAVLTVALYIQLLFIGVSLNTLFQEGNPSWKIICASIGGGIFLILFIITAYRLFRIIKNNKKQITTI
ncbi:hypothetical protein [uncultured Bacteroides sp.]|uniref:hypothetical protein n=1 Tax=uncultured Bacteroides sp. TaxID=162156 RepID=UPI00262AB122|nr:hypothetical protein [uncultured Bacteroides sp.]